MKTCAACSSSNGDDCVFCSACGTILAPPQLPSSEAIERSAGASLLNAGTATKVLVLFLAGQILGGFLVGFIASAASVATGNALHDPQQMRSFARTISEPALVLSFVMGGAAMLLTARSLPREQLADGSPTGAAWTPGTQKQIMLGLGAGLVAGFCFLLFALLISQLFPPSKTTPAPVAPGPLGVLVALVLAPPIEELLFRGLLYGGYRRSLGATKAAVITTVIFCLLHTPQLLQFPPGVVGIAGLALLALALRLRSGAIGPSVAAHFGYNAVLTFVLMGARSHPGS
jgi:membrane protease YdiL (CAAX protease family)